MDERIYKKICSILLENGSWYLLDCNGERLQWHSEKRIFSSAMKRRYLKNRTGRTDIPTVWVLVGITHDSKKIYEQVGRTKDLINSLNEIKENIKELYNSVDGKYGNLKKKYKEIVFYEIDINKYLDNNDKLFIKMYGNPPEDTFLSLAYYFIRAAYVEGKLGYETHALMYRKSSFDEYYYSYYENLDNLKNSIKN